VTEQGGYRFRHSPRTWVFGGPNTFDRISAYLTTERRGGQTIRTLWALKGASEVLGGEFSRDVAV